MLIVVCQNAESLELNEPWFGGLWGFSHFRLNMIRDHHELDEECGQRSIVWYCLPLRAQSWI